jgi:hypothetical protein
MEEENLRPERNIARKEREEVKNTKQIKQKIEMKLCKQLIKLVLWEFITTPMEIIFEGNKQ